MVLDTKTANLVDSEISPESHTLEDLTQKEKLEAKIRSRCLAVLSYAMGKCQQNDIVLRQLKELQSSYNNTCSELNFDPEDPAEYLPANTHDKDVIDQICMIEECITGGRVVSKKNNRKSLRELINELK